MSKVWAFVDRRDEDGELVGSFEEIALRERIESQERRQLGRELYHRRIGLRLSLMAMGLRSGLGMLRVSEIEQGYCPEATPFEVAAIKRILAAEQSAQ